jgi:hypothetical protein
MVISEDTALEMYDEQLDAHYGPVKIGILEYDVAHVLKYIDPVAYNEGFRDYVETLLDDETYVEGYTDDLVEEEEEPTIIKKMDLTQVNVMDLVLTMEQLNDIRRQL